MELQAQKKRFIEIDSLKGFAMFFVILGHAIILFPINLHQNPYCLWLFTFVSSVHVPLFFVVSGFCFSYKGFKNYISKKAKRILLPYFVFSFFDIFPRVLLPEYVNRSKSLSDAIIAIFLTGGEYWFLYCLFLIFVLYIPIFFLQRNNKTLQIIIEVLLFGAAICLSYYKIPTDLFVINKLIYYLFFFNSGWLIKKYWNNLFDFRFKIEALNILVPAVLFSIWVSIITFRIVSGYEVVPYCLTTILAIITMFFVSKFHWFNFIFSRFGQYTLQLYLFNGFTLVASRVIICKITSNPAAIICFNTFVDFYLTYLFIKYLWSKVKFFRFISGM